MTRQSLRRLAVLGAAAALGAGSPVWGPRILRTVPGFRVTDVRVTGIRFVSSETARHLAAFSPEASVWDDHSASEARLRTHPLIRDARIRRTGLNRLTIEVHEVRPVALASTPLLVPVDGEGSVLPIDPAEHGLDLPILQEARVESGRVSDEDSRRVLAALARLHALNPEFVERVSEVRRLEGDAILLRLLKGSHAERVVLPLEGTVVAFLRVEDALRECAERGRIIVADARFRDQVVIRLGRDS